MHRMVKHQTSKLKNYINMTFPLLNEQAGKYVDEYATWLKLQKMPQEKKQKLPSQTCLKGEVTSIWAKDQTIFSSESFPKEYLQTFQTSNLIFHINITKVK